MAISRKSSSNRSLGRRKRAQSKKMGCKGKLPYACVTKPGCKVAKGKKLTYCRTRKNRKYSH